MHRIAVVNAEDGEEAKQSTKSTPSANRYKAGHVLDIVIDLVVPTQSQINTLVPAGSDVPLLAADEASSPFLILSCELRCRRP